MISDDQPITKGEIYRHMDGSISCVKRVCPDVVAFEETWSGAEYCWDPKTFREEHSAIVSDVPEKTSPPHYAARRPEPITVIEGWGLGFHLGNSVKYIARAGTKPGESALDDLRKARWYLDREIARLESVSGGAGSEGER